MGSWFKKPVNIAITVAAVLGAVLALTVIIWKVSTRDLDAEAPMLEVCWADGQAYYVGGIDEGEGERRAENESCEGPSELVWAEEEIPLRLVAISPEGENMDENPAVQRIVKRAISDFNSQAGCELLIRIPHSARSVAHVQVHWGTAIEVGASLENGRSSPGTCTHRGAGAPIEAHVGVRGGLSDRAAYLVLLHEIGHAFGIGHNLFSGSVMYPFTVDDTNFERMAGGRLSDGTVYQLNHRYCP